MNTAALAYERAVRHARVRAAVVRALATWEVWIIFGSSFYFAVHFAAWREMAYRVVGR